MREKKSVAVQTPKSTTNSPRKASSDQPTTRYNPYSDTTVNSIMATKPDERCHAPPDLSLDNPRILAQQVL
jgi:hypothetical protein